MLSSFMFWEFLDFNLSGRLPCTGKSKLLPFDVLGIYPGLFCGTGLTKLADSALELLIIQPFSNHL